jgi:hypothetical protein
VMSDSSARFSRNFSITLVAVYQCVRLSLALMT